MSNEIKMSDYFKLPIKLESRVGSELLAICDSAGSFGILNVHAFDAVKFAIENHDHLTQENARLTELAAQKASRCDELYELLLSCRSALHEANMYVGFDFNAQLDNISRLVSKINNEGSDNE